MGATGGNDQVVVGLGNSTRGIDRLADAVNPAGPDAGVELHPVLLVPGKRVDENVIGIMAARQDAGEENPVVITVGFFPEHDNVELFRSSPIQHLLHKAGSGHTIADYH